MTATANCSMSYWILSFVQLGLFILLLFVLRFNRFWLTWAKWKEKKQQKTLNIKGSLKFFFWASVFICYCYLFLHSFRVSFFFFAPSSLPIVQFQQLRVDYRQNFWEGKLWRQKGENWEVIDSRGLRGKNSNNYILWQHGQ